MDNNASSLPPKILRNHCFQFILGITVAPREIEDNGYAKFWGVNNCIMAHLEMVNYLKL